MPETGDKTDIKRCLDYLFLEHPRAVGEGYVKHLLFTLKVAAYLIITAFCITLHGFIPRLCQTTGSDRIARLHDRLRPRAVKVSDTHETGKSS